MKKDNDKNTCIGMESISNETGARVYAVLLVYDTSCFSTHPIEFLLCLNRRYASTRSAFREFQFLMISWFASQVVRYLLFAPCPEPPTRFLCLRQWPESSSIPPECSEARWRLHCYSLSVTWVALWRNRSVVDPLFRTSPQTLASASCCFCFSP